MLKRTGEAQLQEDMLDFPAIAITGARQVGKTTLAKNIIPDDGRPTLYLDLELPEDVVKLKDTAAFLRRYDDHCVVIDEVQHMPELFPVLRSLIDENRRPGRFLLLGSASPDLMKGSTESLAGRISYLHLHPVNIQELSDDISWNQLWLRGGFPDSLLARNDNVSYRWRKNFLQTYVERDLPMLGLDTERHVLYQFVQYLAQLNANLLNIDDVARSLGVSRTVIYRYLEFLEHSFMIYILKPYHRNIKKRLVKTPKVYLTDTGIFHLLLDVTTQEDLYNNIKRGASWENFVINQTRAILPEPYKIWFFRTHDGAEADMVITKNDEPHACVEIKISDVPKVSRGFGNVIGYLKTKHNYIITPNSTGWPYSDNIEVLSLVDWLEMINNKEWI